MTRWYHRKWVKADGTEVTYSYSYPQRSAVGRCRRYLRKPGAALVPRGHFGLWIGAGDVQFSNRTVKRLLDLGFAERDGDVVRMKGRR